MILVGSVKPVNLCIIVAQKLLVKIELQIARCMDWTRIPQVCLKQAKIRSTKD